MSMAEIPKQTFGEDIRQPSELVDYLRTQFEAAYQKEHAMDQHQGSFDNGSFYQQIPIPGVNQHELVRQSTRIVMKPPFSTMIFNGKDSFAEVYAIYLRGEDGHMVGDESGYFADQYLVRLFQFGRYGKFELVSDEGVISADVESFDPVGGFSGIEEVAEDIAQEVDMAVKSIIRANELHRLLAGWNIVATKD